MNKENRRMAQERRAQEREKALRKEKLMKVLPILLIAAAAVIAVIAYFALKQGKQGDNAVRTAAEQTEAAGEQKDASKEGSALVNAQAAKFDASAIKGCYDISGDDLTYVQIRVKDYGTITAALDATVAPVSVENFLNLVRDGFYDGLTFHRIIDGFMIQGGDPSGNGTGGSGKNIKGEFSENGVENPITHVRGAISMARSQMPDSASSQFFIVQSDSNYLDGQYAGFGYVTDGMEIVDQICKDAKPTDGNGTIAAADQPVIESVTILDSLTEKEH